MTAMRLAVASCLVLLVSVSAWTVEAQAPEVLADGALLTQSFALKHKKATEAVQLVYPLLSSDGSVSVVPRSNTLVVRDVARVIQSVGQALRAFDRPARPLRLELILVKASRNQPGAPARASDVPEPLARRLRAWLPYDTFEKQGEAVVSTLEGEAAFFGIGNHYEVSFRVGTLAEGQRIKLADFCIARPRGQGQSKAELIRTNLNLVLDQTLNLGLAKSEASREALMVVLTIRQAGASRQPAGKEP